MNKFFFLILDNFCDTPKVLKSLVQYFNFTHYSVLESVWWFH